MSDLNFDANFEDYVSFKANFGIVTSTAAVVDPTVTEDSPNPVASSGIYTFVKDEVSAEKTSRDAAIFAESQERMKGDEDIQRYVTTKIEAEESARSSADTDLANSISELSRNTVKTVNHIAPDAEGNVNVEGGGSGLVDDVKVNGVSVVTDKVANVAVPTKVSSLENDSGYITSADVPDPYDDTEIREEISGLDDKIKDLELFKFPNVTIIGTPTINNGQISDFSATSYLKFPFLVDFRNQPFEINMAFTTGANVVNQENIFDSDYGLAFAIRNSRFVIAISTNGTSWDLGEGVGSLTVQPNTTYYIKIAWNGSQYILYYSFDGVSYIPDITKAGTAQPYPKQIYIGVGENFASVVNHFGGTINLNNANLKVNGEVFWTGMDDAGISTRADVSLSNIDADGEEKIKEVAETDSIKDSLNNKIEDSALTPLRDNISTLTSQMANKQDKLVSGTNIKTINGNTLLGSGDISVGGSSEPTQLNIADHLLTTPARATNVTDISFASNMDFGFTVAPGSGYENLVLTLDSLNIGSEYLLEYDVTLNDAPAFTGSYSYETYVSNGIPKPETNNGYNNLPKTQGETKHYSMSFFNENSTVPMYLCFFMALINGSRVSFTVSNLKLSVKEYSGASESEIEQIKEDLNELDDKVEIVVSGGYVPLTVNYIEGGYIDQNSGEVVSYANWKYTDFIDLARDENLIYLMTDGSRSVYNMFYDENKTKLFNVVDNVGYLDGTTVSARVRYIRLSCKSTATQTLKVFKTRYVTQKELSDINKIKVATFNVGMWYDGRTPYMPNEEVYERSTKYRLMLGDNDADFICLQEADNKLDRNQTIDALPYLFGFKYSYFYSDGSRAIVSKRRIRNFETVNFASGSGKKYCKGEITLNDKNILLINAHTNANVDKTVYRVSEYQELISLMNSVDYAICLGDFNAFNVDEFDLFTNAGLLVSNHGIFGDFDTWTNLDRPHTDWPNMCIDNIITTSNISIQNVVCDRKDLSDHNMLVSEIRIE